MAHTTQVMPSLKAVNFNYFLSVKGFLEHDHITVNTTIIYKQSNRYISKFINEPMTIV